jgi:hypothetical protein
MRALVVYESMYGNTDRLAHAVASGLAEIMPVAVANVNHVTAADLSAIDLLVVGGPTHVHGMSREGTRQAAVASSTEQLPLDEDASGTGVREWLHGLSTSARCCAAFGTRIDMPRWMTGAAAAQIARVLASHGLVAVAETKDFLVSDATQLEPGQLELARLWGAIVGAAAVTHLAPILPTANSRSIT